jgi:putative tricarboxylic transport membrane protein
MKDKIFSIFIIIFCFVMFLQTYNFDQKTLFQPVSSAFYPRIIIIVIFIFSLILLLLSFTKKQNNNKIKFNKQMIDFYKNPIIIFSSFAIYIYILPIIHFIPATLLFLFAGQLLLYENRRLRGLFIISAVSVSSTFIIYFTFLDALNILLP